MSLLHKAITLSGACAIGLTLAFAAPAAAEDAKPINFRAVGGAVLGGTWNVGLTGVGKLVNDRYPGSAINVLQGASVSNPLRLEQNAADVTLTQTFNTVAARDGKAPYKKPLKNVASLANMNDTSRLSIIVSADLPVNTFDELMEKKLPVRLDRGAKGTLHNVVGAMLLAEYGYTYDDITKWGGAHTAVSANDRVGMFQDGTLNAYLTLGPGQQSHIQELVLNAKVKFKGGFRAIYFLPMVCAPAAIAMVWRWMFNGEYGIINQILGTKISWLTDPKTAILACAIVAIWSSIGYDAVLLLSGLQNISKSYYEAARIDGAGRVKQFFSITLPMISPTLFVTLIMRMMASLKVYDLIYMMVDQSNPVLPDVQSLMYLFYREAFVAGNKGYASAIVIWTIFLIGIVTIVQFIGQKKWVNYDV